MAATRGTAVVDHCQSSHVVLRAELAPLGGAPQVSPALKALQRDGELLRLGAGVCAKARRGESTHKVMPVVDVEALGREVAHKRKAQVTDGGDGTLVLDTGDRRVSRKLALGQGAVQDVNDRNRRTFIHGIQRAAAGCGDVPDPRCGQRCALACWPFIRFCMRRRPPISGPRR
jgi:hypothetical protein